VRVGERKNGVLLLLLLLLLRACVVTAADGRELKYARAGRLKDSRVVCYTLCSSNVFVVLRIIVVIDVVRFVRIFLQRMSRATVKYFERNKCHSIRHSSPPFPFRREIRFFLKFIFRHSFIFYKRTVPRNVSLDKRRVITECAATEGKSRTVLNVFGVFFSRRRYNVVVARARTPNYRGTAVVTTLAKHVVTPKENEGKRRECSLKSRGSKVADGRKVTWGGDVVNHPFSRDREPI